MEKLKVYIAGKITGTDHGECIRKFNKASEIIEKMGFQPVNPLTFGIPWDTASKDAVQLCTPHLLSSDILFLLSDYRTSEGALEEFRIFYTKIVGSRYRILTEDGDGFGKLANYTKMLKRCE